MVGADELDEVDRAESAQVGRRAREQLTDALLVLDAHDRLDSDRRVARPPKLLHSERPREVGALRIAAVCRPGDDRNDTLRADNALMHRLFTAVVHLDVEPTRETTLPQRVEELRLGALQTAQQRTITAVSLVKSSMLKTLVGAPQTKR